MRRAPSLLLLAALLLAAVPAHAAEAPGLEAFLRIRTPTAPELLPDGSLLIRDWPDGVWQLWRVRPDAAGSLVSNEATREKLTDFPDGLARYSLSPDRRHLVLMHARGGDENTQLTLVDLSDPSARKAVLSDPKVQADVNLWLRDGSGFIYSANATTPNDFHLYRYDLASGETREILAREGSWRARDITDDGKRVLVTREVSASDSHVYELELASGKLTELTLAPPNGTAACDASGYLPGERAVLIGSDYQGARSRLYVRDLASGRVQPVLAALNGHDLEGARIGTRRDLLVVTSNEEGDAVLHAYTLPELKPVALPPIERGIVGVVSLRANTLVYALSNARRPGIAYASDLARAGPAGTPRAITTAEMQGVNLADFPLPQVIHYRTFDGRQIPALLYLPPGRAAGTPIPFIVNYHGGPEGQARPNFNAMNQYLVSRGYGLLLPNVRGSTGYGREFQMLDDYKKRWDSVRDGVAGAAWLVENHYALAGKIASTGGSYGGFMSVACVVEDQEAVDRGERKQRLFGACVDVVGIVNMKTFLERTSGYRRKLREVEYGPLSDPDFLLSISSLQRVDKIQVPIFIAHGFNDPRVPVEEAMQLAAAMRSRGRPARLFIAPDEGHGFVKFDNRLYYGERVTAFYDETLKGQVSSTRPLAGAGE